MDLENDNYPRNRRSRSSEIRGWYSCGHLSRPVKASCVVQPDCLMFGISGRRQSIPRHIRRSGRFRQMRNRPQKWLTKLPFTHCKFVRAEFGQFAVYGIAPYEKRIKFSPKSRSLFDEMSQRLAASLEQLSVDRLKFYVGHRLVRRVRRAFRLVERPFPQFFMGHGFTEQAKFYISHLLNANFVLLVNILRENLQQERVRRMAYSGPSLIRIGSWVMNQYEAEQKYRIRIANDSDGF